jgi:hypothetical protein
MTAPHGKAYGFLPVKGRLQAHMERLVPFLLEHLHTLRADVAVHRFGPISAPMDACHESTRCATPSSYWTSASERI